MFNASDLPVRPADPGRGGRCGAEEEQPLTGCPALQDGAVQCQATNLRMTQDLEARLHAVHLALVPDLGELVTGGTQFVDEAGRRRVITPLRCQGAEIRHEPCRSAIVGVRWRRTHATPGR